MKRSRSEESRAKTKYDGEKMFNYKKARQYPYNTFAINSSVLGLFNELSLNYNFFTSAGAKFSTNPIEIMDAESRRIHNDPSLVGAVSCFSGFDEFQISSDEYTHLVKMKPLEIFVEARSYYTDYRGKRNSEEMLQKVKQDRLKLTNMIFDIIKKSYDSLDVELVTKKPSINHWKLSAGLLKVWEIVEKCESVSNYTFLLIILGETFSPPFYQRCP